MRSEQEVAKRERVVSALYNIGEVDDVAVGFCDFGAFELQMGAMQPETREWFLARGGFGLRYFVVVVHGDVLDTARMDVNLRAEGRAYHRRTLDMPAGEPLPPRAVPAELLV